MGLEPRDNLQLHRLPKAIKSAYRIGLFFLLLPSTSSQFPYPSCRIDGSDELKAHLPMPKEPLNVSSAHGGELQPNRSVLTAWLVVLEA